MAVLILSELKTTIENIEEVTSFDFKGDSDKTQLFFFKRKTLPISGEIYFESKDNEENKPKEERRIKKIQFFVVVKINDQINEYSAMKIVNDLNYNNSENGCAFSSKGRYKISSSVNVFGDGSFAKKTKDLSWKLIMLNAIMSLMKGIQALRISQQKEIENLTNQSLPGDDSSLIDIEKP